MAYLILVAGLPGTGKTSFAKYLSRKMAIPAISKDLLKEQLFDTIGFKNRAEKVKLGTAAMAVMYHIAGLHLEIGLPVILENNFENISKPGLQELIEKYVCKTITVRFQTQMNVLAERFRVRDESPERHRGHVLNTQYPEVNPPSGSETAVDYYSGEYYAAMQKRGMDTFTIGGDEIIVDTTDFSKVSYDKICGEILEIINR